MTVGKASEALYMPKGGALIVVPVRDDGFEYAGQLYRS
jgi:hypothetical protein